jgi:hypothetical protein
VLRPDCCATPPRYGRRGTMQTSVTTCAPTFACTATDIFLMLYMERIDLSRQMLSHVNGLHRVLSFHCAGVQGSLPSDELRGDPVPLLQDPRRRHVARRFSHDGYFDSPLAPDRCHGKTSIQAAGAISPTLRPRSAWRGFRPRAAGGPTQGSPRSGCHFPYGGAPASDRLCCSVPTWASHTSSPALA